MKRVTIEEARMNIDTDVFNFMKQYVDPDMDRNGVIYFRAQKTDKLSHDIGLIGSLSGNIHALGATLPQQMEQDQVTKDFFMAIVGAYLSRHPEEEQSFLNGVNTLRKMMGKKEGE